MKHSLQIKYYAIQTVYWLVNLCTTAFIVPILQAQGFQSMHIGILLGVRALSNVVFQPLVVRILEVKRKNVSLNQLIILLLGCSILLTLIQMLDPSWMIMLLVFIGYGVFTFGISSFIDAMYVLYAHEGKQIQYPFARGLGSLSFSIGAYVFGLVSFLPLLLWAQLVLMMVLIILVLIIEPIYQVATAADDTSIKNNQIIKEYPLLFFFLIATTLSFIGKEMSGNFLVDAYSAVGGQTSDYGLGISIMAFVELPAALFFSRILKRVGITRLMLISFFFSSIRILILWLASDVLYLHVAQVFQMLGAGLFWAGNVQFVRYLLPAKYAVRAQTLIGICYLGIAGGLGSMLSGWIVQQTNITTLLGISFVFSLLGCVTYFIGMRTQEKF
ncbi:MULTISPECIES: MFS transporter [unclassified Breznakia]|uniref:MFS transporter n=1 Tax=unclassified Breznakia TaxID=2623764 RepID=UPI0024748CA7|nr:MULTISPECIES: MFS transporter [unclassified Breznakia]MDH6368052.1 PPP family 3-phenylpropionic acid transporter [Breznakia sp. PH1-1]MDH6405140.1 PPP family 3-phenylpropionic acid transporter [Breznakia sp. PF1-11]MDH6412855.1 PPP family 3-phenylpropionic acid transporter [Breznakia sp. PFB1-11]MDH6415203.1 PPP family 3-phenylpropionic acid transporter [Breznakia sp. PFB1-14]MDH6417513.1 PPP family 3-phenylpropionic acid transporter [Breznakia sp. PFB1-4]